MVLLLMGFVVAVFWQPNGWLVIPALAPLVLIYRALSVPQLRKEAHTDAKTGLLNTRRWHELFDQELERARHFDHALSVIMADLDGLREINNTYSHLAGDKVLTGMAPVLALNIAVVPLDMENLLDLLPPMVLAALTYFAIDSTLIAAAIGLSSGAALRSVWREHFQWLGIHYVVLCLLGLFAAIAYASMGLWGVLVFALPILMMHFTQRQYVQRTQHSVWELRRMNEELAQANDEVVSASQAIQQLNEELFLTLAQMIDVRDSYVHAHASRVAEWATAIALEMGLAEERVVRLHQAALLHDIGKVGIPDSVLQKPARLTDAEYEIIRKHTIMGGEFLETSRSLRHLVPHVRHHHECWDGSGYPDGLRGEEIPLEARILAVSDAVEAMSSDRPYRQALSQEEVVAELRRCAGAQFDPEVVEAFVRTIQRTPDQPTVSPTLQALRSNHEARANSHNEPRADHRLWTDASSLTPIPPLRA